MGGLGAELQQEAGKAEAEIGIAVDRELLAVNMGAKSADRIDETATLLGQFRPETGLPVMREIAIRNSSVALDADRMIEARRSPGHGRR